MTDKLVKLSDVEEMINKKLEDLYFEESIMHRTLTDVLESLSSLPTQNEWIPVSKRLPRNGVNVIVKYKTYSGTNEGIACRYDGKWSGWAEGLTIIEWMPLPPTN